MNILKFYGHSCAALSNGSTTILFDPFFTDNPFNTAQAQDISCNYILVSHAHFDHLGDAINIAKRCSATIISTAEVAHLCSSQGCQAHAMHIGGEHAFDFGSVKLTLALHGAGIEGGHACGFIVHFFDTTIYFAGDTGIFGDMALIGRQQKIDYALLPIGDNFTMGPADAAEAAAMLRPRAVIPIHYNTWPVITVSPEAFKADVEKKLNIPVHIIVPGESLPLD